MTPNEAYSVITPTGWGWDISLLPSEGESPVFPPGLHYTRGSTYHPVGMKILAPHSAFVAANGGRASGFSVVFDWSRAVIV